MLALAGVSIGMKLNDIKKLSWKMIIVALVVFIGTFFGSAIVAHLILKFQGII
ncbi:MAG: LysO family transporter [Angelakisella sp.]